MRPGIVEPVPPGSAADSLLGPQSEVRPTQRDGWDVSMCEKWAVEKVGVSLNAYRAYLVRTYGSTSELDGVMLWDQREVLTNAARDSVVRSGLVKAIMGAFRSP